METALRFVNNHLVASTNKNRNGARVTAFLNNQHAVLGRAKRDLSDASSETKLGSSQLLEARDNAALGGNSDQLNGNVSNGEELRGTLASISGPPTQRTAGSSFCRSR